MSPRQNPGGASPGSTCPRCGAPDQGDARFCGGCGAAVSSTEPASSPSLGEPPAMIGREIAGRYRVLAKIGEGGMGAVFRAEQISLRRTVAVKLLRPDVLGNQMLLRRFNAEAEAVAKLSHPNTVNIYDFGQDADGTLFIAMELIEGRSLRSVIQREAPLPPRRALAIAVQVAASLSDAHARSIIHRDLKPDNVMLQDRGRERDVARVLDFGIAKLRDDTRATQMQMTQQGDMLGTPQYMAPEQIRAEAVDGRTDIYALGCLLYEMVTARLPHEAPTVLALLSKHLLEQPVPPSQRRPELGLPGALDRLILAAMAKLPAARPPTMDVFGEQLAALLAALPVDSSRPGGPRSEAGQAVAPTLAPDAPSLAIGGVGFAGSPHGVDTPAAHSAYAAPGALGPASSPPLPTPPGAPLRAFPAHGPPAPAPPASDPRGFAASVAPQHGYLPPPVLPGPPGHVVTHQVRPRPAGGRLPILPIAAAAVAAIGILVLVVVQATSRTPRAGHAEAPSTARSGPTSDDHDRATPPAPDPWGAQAPVDGTRIGVGQGVQLIVPSGFETSMQSGLVVAHDATGILIMAGLIDIPGDDPMELARAHARRNGLVFDTMKTVFVGGVQRPMAMFHGTYRGVAFRHIAVALIGPSYRVAVAFQAPTRQFTDDHALEGRILELYTRRIVLP